jgi:hypothetical protein
MITLQEYLFLYLSQYYGSRPRSPSSIINNGFNLKFTCNNCNYVGYSHDYLLEKKSTILLKYYRFYKLYLRYPVCKKHQRAFLLHIAFDEMYIGKLDTVNEVIFFLSRCILPESWHLFVDYMPHKIRKSQEIELFLKLL